MILAFALLAALVLQPAPPGPQRPFIERGVPVAMRDGVRLSADVLRPAAEGRFPTLVYRTPYDRKRSEDDEVVRAAVARGYAVVLQDVRGRYDSAGLFTPYVHEGKDGYDTIEWAAAQPWSTGEIGTFGLSYPGAVQWLAAVESPPHLKAMVPAMTFSSPRNFFYAGGAWDLSWLPWIWNNIAPDARVRRGLPGPRTGKEASAAWKEPPVGAAVPASADRRARSSGRPRRTTSTGWPTGRASRGGTGQTLRGRYGRVTAAVLSLSGWHDEAYGPEGAMTNFLGLLEARRGEKDPRAEIILGPWVHGGEDSDRSGERVFGPRPGSTTRARSCASWTGTCAASRTARDRLRACVRS